MYKDSSCITSVSERLNHCDNLYFSNHPSQLLSEDVTAIAHAVHLPPAPSSSACATKLIGQSIKRLLKVAALLPRLMDLGHPHSMFSMFSSTCDRQTTPTNTSPSFQLRSTKTCQFCVHLSLHYCPAFQFNHEALFCDMSWPSVPHQVGMLLHV